MLEGDGVDTAVLTGDTILGRGTTVVAHPDGELGPYLASLERLRGFGAARVLPGHGPELAEVAAVAEQYLAHREQRLQQVRSALATLGPDATARQIVEVVYADVDQAVWWAAELSVRAQLDYLSLRRPDGPCLWCAAAASDRNLARRPHKRAGTAPRPTSRGGPTARGRG